MTTTETKYRTVQQIAPAQRTTEGGGVPIRRAFPTSRLEDVDPFLLFDHLGPLDFKPGEALGFPDHPHRGFETVTYLLEGAMEHRDSFGHHGIIEAGDVQWMTAGSGLVHSEMPGADIVKNGGRLHGFQIWVNLPKRNKMKEPRYQERKASAIPVAENEDGTVKARVVAGEALGKRGAVETHTPIIYVHFTLAPGASVIQDIPLAQNAIVYVIKGEVAFNNEPERATEGRVATFAHDGDQVLIANAGELPADVLVLSGEPLNEPVARYGPFVMNTKEELYRAFEDYRAGKMGTIV
jgi:redox-sensitive bicupin YhaK (pirin superfamily)